MDRLRERIEPVGNDDESAGAADHAVEVIPIEVLELREAETIGPVVDDGQAVDGDATLDRDVDQSATIVGAVARDIDDPPSAFIAIVIEQRHRILNGAADRGAPANADLCFGQ